MNGIHDMGGDQGYGPVKPEVNEPPFHADWERRALALTLAMGAHGLWNIDQMRHEREKLPPEQYLTASYYGIWTLALENAIRETGALERTDLRARTADELVAGFSRRVPYERPVDTQPAFAVGDRVHTRELNPAGHTRLPQYARDKVGTVLAVRGAHVFADRNAAPMGQRGAGEAEWLYTVEFTGTELWGPDADPHLVVSVEAWEPYLEAAR